MFFDTQAWSILILQTPTHFFRHFACLPVPSVDLTGVFPSPWYCWALPPLCCRGSCWAGSRWVGGCLRSPLQTPSPQSLCSWWNHSTSARRGCGRRKTHNKRLGTRRKYFCSTIEKHAHNKWETGKGFVDIHTLVCGNIFSRVLLDTFLNSLFSAQSSTLLIFSWCLWLHHCIHKRLHVFLNSAGIYLCFIYRLADTQTQGLSICEVMKVQKNMFAMESKRSGAWQQCGSDDKLWVSAIIKLGSNWGAMRVYKFC